MKMDTWHSEELIAEFHRVILGAGFSKEASARNRDKMRFFLHAYVAEEWPRGIERVNAEMVRDFLGSWFIRHVGGSKSDMLNYLAVFKRFYHFLYQSGRISSSEYEDIMEAVENREYFMARHDDFFHPMPDAWEEFASGRSLAIAAAEAFPHDRKIDRQLWMLAKNLERPDTPAVLDFALFLDYVGSKRPNLTRVNSKLPRRHVDKVNARFSKPERLRPHSGMEGSARVSWFFHMALEMGLCAVTDDNRLELPPRAEDFLDLCPDTQLALIIDFTWERMPWSCLAAGDDAMISDWAQEHKDGFAALLSGLNPGRTWLLDIEPGRDHREALLARYILFHDVVERNILFAFGQTGILVYERSPDPNGRALNIRSITMTRFGRQVMRLFERRACRSLSPEESPLIRLRECLLV